MHPMGRCGASAALFLRRIRAGELADQQGRRCNTRLCMSRRCSDDWRAAFDKAPARGHGKAAMSLWGGGSNSVNIGQHCCGVPRA